MYVDTGSWIIDVIHFLAGSRKRCRTQALVSLCLVLLCFRVKKPVFFKKGPDRWVLLGFLGTGFYWFFGRVLKYEWQVLNVIYIN